MISTEFDKPAGRTPVVTAPVTPFPDKGSGEAEVIGGIRERLGRNPYDVDRDFGNSYSGIPHPITHQLDELMRSTYFVEWAADQQPGTMGIEREAVRMMASLLGAPEGAGFITSGGTESNLASMRLARAHGGQAQPQIVAPVTMHFSFRMGAELMGIELVEVEVDRQSFVPRIEDVERARSRRAPSGWCALRRRVASAPWSRWRRLRTSRSARVCGCTWTRRSAASCCRSSASSATRSSRSTSRCRGSRR